MSHQNENQSSHWEEEEDQHSEGEVVAQIDLSTPSTPDESVVGEEQGEIPVPPLQPRNIDSIAQELGGQELTISMYPEQPQFSEYTSQSIEVVHRFSTLNRAIEAVYDTDVIFFAGRFPQSLLGESTGKKYTRRFEPVGDYVPNLAFEHEGQVHFVQPKNWGAVTYHPKSMSLSEPTIPVKEGWVRYKSLPGKVIEIYFGKTPEKAQNFLVIQGAPFYQGLTFRAIKLGINVSDKKELGAIGNKPQKPSSLFAKAVKRAKTVEELTIVYHTLPTPQELGGSPDAQTFHKLRSEGPKVSLGKSVGTYLEALSLLGESLQADRGVPEELKASVKTVLKTIDTEASARVVYQSVLKALPQLGPKEEKFFCYESEEMKVHEEVFVTIHVAGAPELFRVTKHEQLKVPFPLYVAPENSDVALRELMKYGTYLTSKSGVTMYRSSFKGLTDYYAPSVMPRNPTKDRGTGGDGLTWYEKMQASFFYHGLLFFPPLDPNEDLEAWVLSINTALLANFFRRGPTCPAPIVLRLPEPLPWPLAPPPAYFAGVGLSGDSILTSPYVQNLDLWKRESMIDSRVRLPSNECLKILGMANATLTNARAFLNQEGPLTLLLRIEGEERSFSVSPQLRINPDGKTFEEVVRYERVEQAKSVAGTETSKVPAQVKTGSTLPPLVLIPSPLIYEPDSNGLQMITKGPGTNEWGMSGDPGFPGNRVAASASYFRFGNAPGYREDITRRPTWPNVHALVKNGEMSESMARNIYSICAAAACDIYHHPVLAHVNPTLVESLINKQIDKRWWSWPTATVKLHPIFMATDEGNYPLNEQDVRNRDASRRKKENSAAYFAKNYPQVVPPMPPTYYAPTVGGSNDWGRGFRGNPNPQRSRGRGGRARGRGEIIPHPYEHPLDPNIIHRIDDLAPDEEIAAVRAPTRF